jgi:MarR family transcriptional regulator, organic hydroperoxide resistance regulator
MTHAPALAARASSPASGRAAHLERVSLAWLAASREALSPLALTHAQARLLITAAWLETRSDAVRQSDIAEHAGLDVVMTSEVLRALETRGLIARTAHPTDRRAKAIRVTEAGGTLADRAARLLDAVEERFFQRGLAEFGPLAKALKKGGRGADSSA